MSANGSEYRDRVLLNGVVTSFFVSESTGMIPAEFCFQPTTALCITRNEHMNALHTSKPWDSLKTSHTSNVTIIDPQPLSASANADSVIHETACCQSIEPTKESAHALERRTTPGNLRSKWLFLTAISAAITVAIAPLSIGAFHRATDSTPEAPLVQDETKTVPTLSEEDIDFASLFEPNDTSPQSTTAMSSQEQHADSEQVDSGRTGDYVALREPTEDGERVRIVVFEPNRDIYIHESDHDGIQVRIRRYLFGTSTEQIVSASDIQDLKSQSQDAFDIYRTHIDKARLLSPAVSIYPAEEVAWLEPSGFLTALSIDEPKNKSDKGKTKKESKSVKKESSAKQTAKKKSTTTKKGEASPKSSSGKKPSSKESASTKNSSKDSSKNSANKNVEKKTANKKPASSKEKMKGEKTTSKTAKERQSKSNGTKSDSKDAKAPKKSRVKDKPDSKSMSANTSRFGETEFSAEPVPTISAESSPTKISEEPPQRDQSRLASIGIDV